MKTTACFSQTSHEEPGYPFRFPSQSRKGFTKVEMVAQNGIMITHPKSIPAGLIFDSSLHYLDHLGPFCALCGYPLIITESFVREKASQHYPDLHIIPLDREEVPQKLSQFPCVISCSPTSLLRQSLGPLPCPTIWLPHGNSDKGQIVPYFDALREEQTALVYGSQMAGIIAQNCPAIQQIPVGRYRLLYYQKHRAFYQQNFPIQFPQKQPTILYAPTWEDTENNCSFWTAFPQLADHLPPSFNLIVKPHPNTAASQAPQIEALIGKYEKGSLRFLLDYPPIFPLLDQVDYYLGDRSSIGYDFLYFDRPLFFLDPHENSRGKDLTSAGTTTQPQNFYNDLSSRDHSCFSSTRRSMYCHAFDSISVQQIQQAIRNSFDRSL